jgi:hypothetical protein
MSAITNDSIRQQIVKHLKDSNGAGILNMYIVFSDDSTRSTAGVVDTRADFSSICNTVNNDGTIQAKFAKRLRASDPSAITNLLNYALLSEFGATGTEVSINGINYTVNPTLSVDDLWNALYANINLASRDGVVYNVVTIVTNLKTAAGASAGDDFVTTFKYDPNGTDSFADDTAIIMQFKPSDKTITTQTTEFPVLMLF